MKHDDKYFIVNNVPCEECEYCGEQYFEAQVLKKMKLISTEYILLEKSLREKFKFPWKSS